MTRFYLFVAIAITAILGIYIFAFDNAMKRCQELYSYDTCFEKLNR